MTGSLQGGLLTYIARSSRTSNRVLIVLVVMTIVVVAYWAVNGGFDEIPVTQTGTVTVTE